MAVCVNMQPFYYEPTEEETGHLTLPPVCWVLCKFHLFLVDLGSDDQQVPVFSDQLLWNPY